MAQTNWAALALDAERKKPSKKFATPERTDRPERAEKKTPARQITNKIRKRYFIKRKNEPLNSLAPYGDKKIALPLWARRAKNISALYRVAVVYPDFQARICSASEAEEMQRLEGEALSILANELEKFERKRSMSPRAMHKANEYVVKIGAEIITAPEIGSTSENVMLVFVRGARMNTGRTFLRTASKIICYLGSNGRGDLAGKLYDYAFQKFIAAGKEAKAARLALPGATDWEDGI